MSSLLLHQLNSKRDVDIALRGNDDKVVVLRFGKADNNVCMELDHVLANSQEELQNLASIYAIDMDAVPIYTKYFELQINPSTIFFFNTKHMKVDYGTQDHTKFYGAFKHKQDFIDLIEVIYRGAMKGKYIVQSPIDPSRITHYDLIYKGI
eukprot:gb/GECH01014626.1/.p1 GENE.gb/GECH01014626.1/~~gb/GECH01014626.1/.p1  ORF type:complete len:151 (+),score=29.96 gb/GECH01014626.1/:1-453(+)